MICVVIKGPSFEEADRQILKALPYADLVELRIDSFQSLDISALKQLRSRHAIPMIFTLRSQKQGGNQMFRSARLDAICLLAALEPEYLDLENEDPPSFIKNISSTFPKIKLILSYHNFHRTAEEAELDLLYQKMQQTTASFYKIAVMAHHSLDAMRLLCWAKKSNVNRKLIAISMGSHGQISRILGPVIGNRITYSTLDKNHLSAPGQLPASTLLTRYRYNSCTPHTAIYGLIGDPVDQSVSDETHNYLFKTCGIDAIYLKIQVKPSELACFLQLAKQLSFRGLSVTMPLKECILPFLDYIEPDALAIGAVNTLLFEEGRVIGTNTDGVGALNAINKVSPGLSRVLLIGAGGAAKAIAHEALKRGKTVTIVNRNSEKARQTAQILGCAWVDKREAIPSHDLLINCTPASLPISPGQILPGSTVMDITTKPKESLFLTLAAQKHCSIIYGYEMFIEQAIGQFSFWFKDLLNIQTLRKTFEGIDWERLVFRPLLPHLNHLKAKYFQVKTSRKLLKEAFGFKDDEA